MSADARLLNEIADLTFLAVEGVIVEEQMARLEDLFIRYPQAVEYYVELINTRIGLNEVEGILAFQDKHILAEIIERDIDAIEAQEARRIADAEIRGNKKELHTQRQHPLRLTNFRIFGAIAALIVFAVILETITKWAQQTEPPAVATLIDASYAEWANPEASISIDAQLYPGPMDLRKGFAKIKFVNGAEALLQAPCRLLLEEVGQMYLKMGAMTAVVPPEAVGFTVRSAGASVVDFGTEFGVAVYGDNRIETHVFKGEVDLRKGSNLLVYDKVIRLEAGQAGRIDKDGLLDPNIFKAQSHLFTRQIPQKPVASHGVPMFVRNYGFEEVGSDERVVQLDNVPGWESEFINISGANSSFSGSTTVNSNSRSVNGIPGEGNRSGTIGRGEFVWQKLEYYIAKNNRYTLAIDTKLSLTGPSDIENKQTKARYSFYCVNDDGEYVELASNELILKDRRTWTRDHTLVLDASKILQECIGKQLEIRISNIGSEKAWVHIDKVRVYMMFEEDY